MGSEMCIRDSCGSFHKEEVESMLEFAIQEAESKNWVVSEIIWVPGSMEAPLALDRMLKNDNVDGAIVLGIIEKGRNRPWDGFGPVSD